MVKQPTVSINLLHIVRLIAVALLICFFLPWISDLSGPISGASVVVSLILSFNNGDVMDLRYLLMVGIVGLGFIPIGSLLILLLSYLRRFHVPVLCILTGIIGIPPFIVSAQPPNDIRTWYFPMLLTALCLLALIVIGIILHRKFATHTPSSAF